MQKEGIFMFKYNSIARRICLVGMLAALYLALNMVGFKAWSFHITFASLPVIVGSLLFGPAAGMLIAAIGEFFNQLLSYGITVTTVLWLIPPAVRGLVVGGSALLLGNEQRHLEDRYALCYGVCVAAALCTTAVNTAVMYVDSVIMGYYSFAYVFGSAVIRIISGILTAIVVTTVGIPLVRLLRRQGIVRRQA